MAESEIVTMPPTAAAADDSATANNNNNNNNNNNKETSSPVETEESSTPNTAMEEKKDAVVHSSNEETECASAAPADASANKTEASKENNGEATNTNDANRTDSSSLYSSTTTTATASQASSSSKKRPLVFDLAESMGLQPGDRVQVEWDVALPEPNNDNDTNNNDSNEPTTAHWWGAQLLAAAPQNDDDEHPTTVTVAHDVHRIRHLQYDAFPEGGFPDQSIEAVVFVGTDQVLLPDSDDQEILRFRREPTDTTDPAHAEFRLARQDVQALVQTTLQRALAQQQPAWNRLDPARQAQMAQTIARKRDKLTELLLEQYDQRSNQNANGSGVVTAQDMHELLARTMASK